VQVRLTAEEYAGVQLRRRRLEAEAKYAARIAAAKDRAAALRGDVVHGALDTHSAGGGGGLAGSGYRGGAASGPLRGDVMSAAGGGGGGSVPIHYGVTSLIHEGPYEEPSRDSYFYRSP
jgi:hypothetical protein